MNSNKCKTHHQQAAFGFFYMYKASHFSSFSSKENLVGKPKECFPTFMDGIPGKLVSID